MICIFIMPQNHCRHCVYSKGLTMYARILKLEWNKYMDSNNLINESIHLPTWNPPSIQGSGFDIFFLFYPHTLHQLIGKYQSNLRHFCHTYQLLQSVEIKQEKYVKTGSLNTRWIPHGKMFTTSLMNQTSVPINVSLSTL